MLCARVRAGLTLAEPTEIFPGFVTNDTLLYLVGPTYGYIEGAQ